jgi:hypothetical protein
MLGCTCKAGILCSEELTGWAGEGLIGCFWNLRNQLFISNIHSSYLTLSTLVKLSN